MAAKLGLNKRKRKDSEASSSGSRPSSSSAAESKPAVRPGDPGWVGRARVPMPDNREFVCRPEWQSHEDMSKTTKKEMDMLEKHKRSFADRKKFSKAQHAVKISLEGKGMKL